MLVVRGIPQSLISGEEVQGVTFTCTACSRQGVTMCAGPVSGSLSCHSRHVQVFDTSSRALLRQLKGHRQPVHVARFGSDKLHVLSAGDDATVSLPATSLV